MIPKIAHFHWEGRPINWLRMMSLYTFARLNPRWEIRLLRSPDHIREKKLSRLANEADWTWLEALYEHGGFAMATDTVFVKPVPDEWCDADLCVCASGRDDFFHCCFGSIPGTTFLRDCVDSCVGLSSTPNLAYQQMGVTLLNEMVRKRGGFRSMGREMSIAYTPAEAMTPVRFHSPERCWAPEPLPITDATVGVTWFGGHPSSAEREWDVPGQHADAAIVKLAMRSVL